MLSCGGHRVAMPSLVFWESKVLQYVKKHTHTQECLGGDQNSDQENREWDVDQGKTKIKIRRLCIFRKPWVKRVGASSLDQCFLEGCSKECWYPLQVYQGRRWEIAGKLGRTTACSQHWSCPQYIEFWESSVHTLRSYRAGAFKLWSESHHQLKTFWPTRWAQEN